MARNRKACNIQDKMRDHILDVCGELESNIEIQRKAGLRLFVADPTIAALALFQVQLLEAQLKAVNDILCDCEDTDGGMRKYS